MSRRNSMALFVTVLVLSAVLSVMAITPAMAAAPTVQVREDPTFGSILVNSKGMTLYQFTVDVNGKSRCFGVCARYWPPLTVLKSQKPTAGPGVTGEVGTVERPDGSLQVTYNGQPLYLNIKDTRPGDAVGQGRNDHFFVVPISGSPPTFVASGKEAAKGPTVELLKDPELGTILVDGAGMTLYVYNNDEIGKSNCTGKCATTWPPLAVDDGDQPVAGTGITAELGVLKRKDGINQVTFGGVPLYLYSEDYYPGDAMGQDVADWFVAQIEAPQIGSEVAKGPTVELLKDPDLGTILVDGSGMILYVYDKDEIGKSNCTGKCAKTWLPLAVEDGVEPTAGAGITAELGVLVRRDGINQVTFEGVPLYLYSGDYFPGDATGQGVKDWYVAQLEAPEPRAEATKQVAEKPTVELLKDPQLGTILVDANGMTLYVYDKDEIGKSNCTGNCAKTWPPLAVDGGAEPIAGAGITAELGVLVRRDGINQVTFEGVPLYLYSKDYYPGDASGQGIKDWYVAQLEAPEQEVEVAKGPTIELVEDPELGSILVDGNGMTVYIYGKDEIGKSNCTGNCAKTWPPVAVDDGAEPIAGAGITAELGVLVRKDGINQVTFAGVPLYVYSKDYYPGDAMGQGIEDWFVAQVQ